MDPELPEIDPDETAVDEPPTEPTDVPKDALLGGNEK